MTEAECSAGGRLLVDDGEVLDYDGYQNRYQFNFTANCTVGQPATQMRLNITQTATADQSPMIQ